MRPLTTLLTVLLLASDTYGAAPPGPSTEEEKAFYALGYAVAENVAAFNLTPAELEMVKAGFVDAATQQPAKLEPRSYFPKLQEMQTQRIAATSQAYLQKAGAEKGAKKLPSGLIMTTLKEGSGASPQATDTVKVHYHGTLANGKVFDSSVQRNEPASFQLDGVIKCWTEGVQLMKVGGKSRLVCPSDIAYGAQGRPPAIPPGAVLIFDVELLSVDKQPAPNK